MAIKLLKEKNSKGSDNGELRQEIKSLLLKNDSHLDQVDDADPIEQAESKATNDGVATNETASASTSTKPAGQMFETPLVWRNIFLFIILHSSIPLAIHASLNPALRPLWQTVAWMFAAIYISGIGVTGGTHRLWSHKSYKARLPVEIVFMCLQSMAGQNSIFTWCRDHRVHHKFSETDADPHNIKRGFFFAHMGWLCCRKHPEVIEKGKLIDLSDLEANPVVMFQHRNFWWLATLFMAVVPTMVPVLFWQERLWTSFLFCAMLRYALSLHGTWLVNSAAHTHGMRPYDERIEARESFWAIVYGLGEGFHNFHHTFPYDYATSEFGSYFNITTAVIDLFALMGLVYDRRKVDKETILKRRLRTGQLVQEAGAQQELSNGKANGILAGKYTSNSFKLDYVSGKTSLKYTM